VRYSHRNERDVMEAQQKITVYEVKCRLCGQKIRSISQDECEQKLSHHIDNECAIASTMRDWDKRGIYKEMMEYIAQEALIDELKKLLKHYTIEQIKEALENIELEEWKR